MRHNEIRDIFAKIIYEVCYDVEVEPTPQLLQDKSFIHKTSNTDDNERLKIKTNGLWALKFRRYFFVVKVFSPPAKSCPKISVEAYNYHESMKCLKYEQRIFVLEKHNFNPLVFSCREGAGPSATRFIKQLASKIAEKERRIMLRRINVHTHNNKFCSSAQRYYIPQRCIGSKRSTDIGSLRETKFITN